MATGQVKIRYSLSIEGRRKRLLMGHQAQPIQEITVDTEITDELLAMTTIDSLGVPTVDLVSAVNVGGFFSAKPAPVDEPIFTLEQAINQFRIFQVEIDGLKEKAKKREEDIARVAKEKQERQHKDLMAYVRFRSELLERKYGTLVWLSIINYSGSNRTEFDKMVEDFERECKRKETEKRRQKSEIEKRLWIEQHASERLKIRYKSGESCHALYVREHILANLGTGWYVDPQKNIEFEIPKTVSGSATHLVENLRRLGFNPDIVWLPKGIVRGEAPEGDDRSKREYDEFYSYDDPAYLPALGGCESIIIENYLGRYPIFYPVGPAALTEGLGRFLKESKWYIPLPR